MVFPFFFACGLPAVSMTVNMARFVSALGVMYFCVPTSSKDLETEQEAILGELPSLKKDGTNFIEATSANLEALSL